MYLPSVTDIRKFFIGELNDEAFTMDKTGQKTIELIGANFMADEPVIFGKVNETYVDAEIAWYENQSTNIHDIYGRGDRQPPPHAWQYSANKHGEINSNYGHLIYSPKFYKQYDQVLDELLKNPDSRRGTMIYNRPSIWKEYNENDKNDFICTNAVSYYIRDNRLDCVVQMRSNDVVYGYKNDYAWQQYVLHKLASDISFSRDEEIESGYIHWQVQNLHVYERHFALVK
jgi:thymidylate synthase